MKPVTLVVSFSALSVGALISIPYEQASRLIPRLAPRIADDQASTKSLITDKDNVQKNFTHNELFTLQKKFLDNFVAPNNAIQVRCTASSLAFTGTDSLVL